MSKKKVADIIIDVLQESGVARCYGIVGDTLNHVTDAIRRSNIEWVHMRHEEAGAFAAGAEAFMTKRLTACAGTCGPGSLHFINGIYEAHRNRAPVILIATQVATHEMGIEFPQEVDLRPIFKQCSVFCEVLANPAEAHRMTVLAAQAALTRRGVAVLIVPGDMTSVDVPDPVPYRVHAPASVVRPPDADLDQMAAILNEGTKIAIYAGAGAEGALDQIIRLCDRLKAPVAHTSRAKDFVEPGNPFNVGMSGLLGVKSGFHAVMDCDTLLLLGADFAWRQFYPEKARVIQVDIDPSHLGRRTPLELGVSGDVGDTIEALLPRLRPRIERAYLDTCLEHVASSEKQLRHDERHGKDGLIHPQHVAASLDRHADADAMFTADGGSVMVWMLRHIKVSGARRTLTSLLHGTMANAMPQALGLKKAYPNRQVISMSGDGGLTMLLGDMLTAIQEKIPVKIVVFNNGTLGFVETEMKVEGLLNAYTELKNPDFGRVAEAMGFHGRRVDHADELEDAVLDLLKQPGPALLDVAVNRFELVMPPTIAASQVASTALYAAKAVLSGRAHDVVDLVVDNFVR